MKKTIPLIGFLLIIIFLTGCRAKPYPFKEPMDEIESVEFVSAKNSLEFFITRTLSEIEKEDFLEQFQKIKFTEYLGDPPGVYGDAIKINYQDGLYEIICYFSAEYIENGKAQFLWIRCDEHDFRNLFEYFNK